MKLISNNKKTIKQFAKFSVVGVLNTLIHYCIFLALYKLIGVHYLVASAIGYIAGIVNSYCINKKWTFNSTGGPKIFEFSKFLSVNAIALGVNMLSLEWLVVYIQIIPEHSQLLAIIFSLTVNFVGNKYWTFK